MMKESFLFAKQLEQKKQFQPEGAKPVTDKVSTERFSQPSKV